MYILNNYQRKVASKMFSKLTEWSSRIQSPLLANSKDRIIRKIRKNNRNIGIKKIRRFEKRVKSMRKLNKNRKISKKLVKNKIKMINNMKNKKIKMDKNKIKRSTMKNLT